MHMQIQNNVNINFKSNYQKRDSSLYSPEGYETLASAGHFIGGSFMGFGILESLAKNYALKHGVEKLKTKKYLTTKWNILWGVLTGIATMGIGRLTNRLTIPACEKIYDRQA